MPFRPPQTNGPAPDADFTALTLLRETFGVEFTAWSHASGAWTEVDLTFGGDTSGESAEARLVAALLDQWACPAVASVRRIAPGRHAVVMPMPSNDQGYAAVGVLETSDADLLLKLAANAERLIEQELLLAHQGRQLHSCLEQLTYDMEEQTWLRSLAQQIKLCDAQTGAEHVAAEILPTLQSLIGAEGVVFVRHELRNNSAVPVEAHYTWAAEAVASEALCERLIVRYGRDAASQPVVVQDRDAAGELSKLGLRSLILVRTPMGIRATGWLLGLRRALRRTPPRRGLADKGPVTSRDEFGTVEAGLVESAAVLLSTHARNVELLHNRSDMTIRLMRAMSSAIDARDAYTRGHSRRVGRYAQGIAKHLKLGDEECEQLYLTGLLHDIGKIGVPDRVLLKAGRLSDDEFDLIKQHPEIGYRILEPIAELSFALPGVLHHHERIDGRGYPHGLQGDDIPFSARILAVADAYDAMTSSRTYRTAMTTDRARQILVEGAGQQWDRNIVGAFLRILDDVVVSQDSTKDRLGDSTAFFVLGDKGSVLDDDDDESVRWQTDSMTVPDELLPRTR
jgi:HD-GYP domain-containing protein (c-di-GMP phosphodiesterase class II)